MDEVFLGLSSPPGTTLLARPSWNYTPGTSIPGTTLLGLPSWDYRPGTTFLGLPSWGYFPGTTLLGLPSWGYVLQAYIEPPFLASTSQDIIPYRANPEYLLSLSHKLQNACLRCNGEVPIEQVSERTHERLMLFVSRLAIFRRAYRLNTMSVAEGRFRQPPASDHSERQSLRSGHH